MIHDQASSLYLSSSLETISVSSKAGQYTMDEKFRFQSDTHPSIPPLQKNLHPQIQISNACPVGLLKSRILKKYIQNILSNCDFRVFPLYTHSRFQGFNLSQMTFSKISCPTLESQLLKKFQIQFYNILDFSSPNIRESINTTLYGV